MLCNREVVENLNEASVRATFSLGCPQGEVFSTLLWCLVLDGFLRRLSEENLFILIIWWYLYQRNSLWPLVSACKCLSILYKSGIYIKNGLTVNPNNLLLFTNKKRLDDFKISCLFNVTLAQFRTVKYLEAVLTLRDRTRKLSHLNYSVTLSLYTVVIRPLVLYSFLV